MPVITLPPNTYSPLEYTLRKEDFVEFTVESDIPVKTYIVRPKAFELFEKGSTTFKYYGGFPDPRLHQKQEVFLPFSGPWYLIISNPSKTKSAEVEYSVAF